jgi:hypothetical protein
MQPPAPYDQEPYPPMPERRPKTTIPKTIGTLNIVFGSLLMLCAICSGVSLAMQSAMGPMMAAQQQQFQKMQEAERAQKLQELQEREKAAADENEKAAIQAQQKALKALPVPKMPDMAKFTQDADLQTYIIADVVTGLLLNILLIVSGIGLLSFKEWGRQLGLWVAAAKIVRLVALYGYFILVVVPNVTKALTTMFKDMFEEAAKAAPPGQPVPGAADMAQMGTAMGIMYTAFAIGMMILGVIYPIIVLTLLSRQRVKAACAPVAIAPDSLHREQ